jgi:hypothetical protein
VIQSHAPAKGTASSLTKGSVAIRFSPTTPVCDCSPGSRPVYDELRGRKKENGHNEKK